MYLTLEINMFADSSGKFQVKVRFRPQLYGLGYARQPSPCNNFSERLYGKTFSVQAKSKLTLNDYSQSLLNNQICKYPSLFEFPSVIRFQRVLLD